MSRRQRPYSEAEASMSSSATGAVSSVVPSSTASIPPLDLTVHQIPTSAYRISGKELQSCDIDRLLYVLKSANCRLSEYYNIKDAEVIHNTRQHTAWLSDETIKERIIDPSKGFFVDGYLNSNIVLLASDGYETERGLNSLGETANGLFYKTISDILKDLNYRIDVYNHNYRQSFKLNLPTHFILPNFHVAKERGAEAEYLAPYLALFRGETFPNININAIAISADIDALKILLEECPDLKERIVYYSPYHVYTNINKNTIDPICELLKANHIRVLDFGVYGNQDKNGIGNTSMGKLCTSLQNPSSLEVLTLGKNHIRKKGIEHLITAINEGKLSNLKKLNIGLTEANAKDLQALKTAILSAKECERLDGNIEVFYNTVERDEYGIERNITRDFLSNQIKKPAPILSLLEEANWLGAIDRYVGRGIESDVVSGTVRRPDSTERFMQRRGEENLNTEAGTEESEARPSPRTLARGRSHASGSGLHYPSNPSQRQ